MNSGKTEPSNTNEGHTNPSTTVILREYTDTPTARPVLPSSPATPLSTNTKPSTPLSFILQLITYTLWSWVLIPLNWLLFILIQPFSKSNTDTGVIIPAFAALIVLLPIALMSDFFYRKHEPIVKKGVALFIMVFYAVVFILISIGFLIAVVSSSMALLISSTSSKDTIPASIISCLLISVLYSLTALRTVRPVKIAWISRLFSIIMAIVAIIVLAATVIGPLQYDIARKNDRLIETNITSMNVSIRKYATEKRTLPANIEAVQLSKDSQMLVDKKLVVYEPLQKQSTESSTETVLRNLSSNNIYTPSPLPPLEYQLCATYAYADEDEDGIIEEIYSNNGNNPTTQYIDTTGHPAGTVCYKQKVILSKN